MRATFRADDAASATCDVVASDQALYDAWLWHMRRGAFEQAWRISDRVLCLRQAAGRDDCELPLHRRSVWDGTPLGGKIVLVRCHHGLGDTIQFIRYVPLIRRIARAVIVQAQPELLPLLASMTGIDRLIARDDAPPFYEVAIESTELPFAFRTVLETIPRHVPYLAIDPATAAAGRRIADDGERLKIGLVWAAGAWRPHRSIALAELAGLWTIPGLAIASLQRGPAVAEIAAFSGSFAWQSRTDEILETAAVMLNLDLVISVDTMAAHLAGALGVPVWTLLSREADWRWMIERSDSPYYPTMRLFRQPAPGAWGPVVSAVGSALGQRRLESAHRKVRKIT